MVSRSQRLCRLCEFPAAGGGVPLDALDADKWAAWCRRELGEELHISSDAEQVPVICQFCIWEARLLHESAINDCCEMNITEGCDWWTGHDYDHFFREYFYKRPLIQPCKVVLENITVDGLGNYAVNDIRPRSTKKTFQCPLCLKIYQSGGARTNHVKQTHKNALRCKSFMCSKYFSKEDERQRHEEKFHLNGQLSKHVKCPFCGVLISRVQANFNYHIKRLHKEAIKCDYIKNCPHYFHTESEKNEHIFNEHIKRLQLKMIPMKCIYCSKISKGINQLASHVHKVHKHVRIMCRVMGCAEYFLSQKESEEHFLQVHQQADNLRKWQCPKCNYKFKLLPHLRRHEKVHLKKPKMKSIFQCPQCPKSFPAKKNLNIHLAAHEERCTLPMLW